MALVTGGSSGIGFAIACELAKRNFPLLLVSNQELQLQECRLQIEKTYGVQCLTLCIDLSDASSAQRVFDFYTAQNLEVEVVVNNAGMLIFSEMVSSPIERVNTILQLHIHTPTMLCRLFAAEMKDKNRGHILNVSSISSVMPYPGISLYGPTKTYMRFFTRALRSEMKIYNVNVTCLIPGATATGLYDPTRVNISLAKRLGIMHAPEFVAGKAVDALMNGKAECVPGVMNKVTMWVIPLIPAFVIQFIHRKTDLVKKGTQALD